MGSTKFEDNRLLEDKIIDTFIRDVESQSIEDIRGALVEDFGIEEVKNAVDKLVDYHLLIKKDNEVYQFRSLFLTEYGDMIEAAFNID